MEIGGVTIASRLALAPMAGVTDLAFRAVCRALGAGYTITEMVSAKALCYQDRKTLPLLALGADEHPAGVQLFGSEIESMERGAVLALEHSGADILDINMGCPVPKVAKNGEGSGLMLVPEHAEALVRAVSRAVSPVPVTVKIRKGWDGGNVNCVDFALRMQDAGAAAIAVHGRTRVQMYGGHADWDSIAAVKRAVSVPVIANGDVFCAEDAVRILRYTGADMVMIGRAAFGNPWVFQQAAAALAGAPVPPRPPLAERCDTAVRQFRLAAAQKGEHIACLEARRHYAWYLKGVPHAGYYREQICTIASLEDIDKITAGIKRDLCRQRGEGRWSPSVS